MKLGGESKGDRENNDDGDEADHQAVVNNGGTSVVVLGGYPRLDDS